MKIKIKSTEKFKKTSTVASTGKNCGLLLWLMAALGSRGVVVKCTAGHLFRRVDCTLDP